MSASQSSLFKKIGIGLSILFVAFFMSPIFFDIEEEEFSNKKVEISKSKIRGFKDGKKNWEIFADYLWTGNSAYLFKAEDIKDGALYDYDGVKVLDHLQSDHVKINTRSKTIQANGNVSAEFYPRESPKKGLIASQNTFMVGDKEKIKIEADSFKYFSISDRTYLKENVLITKDTTRIYPKDEVWVDNSSNIAFIENGVSIDHDGFIVSANTMTIYIDDDYSVIKGSISGFRPATTNIEPDIDTREANLKQKDTHLSCDRMKYDQTNDNKIVELFGNVKIWQDDKILSGDYAKYDENAQEFTIKHNVSIQTDDLLWLLSDAKQANIKGEKTKDSLESETTVTCKTLTFNSESKELELMGNVTIVQPDTTITCNKLRLDDVVGWVFLIGKVSIEKDDRDTLNCDLVSVDIENEVFFASQNVNTEFKIDKD